METALAESAAVAGLVSGLSTTLKALSAAWMPLIEEAAARFLVRVPSGAAREALLRDIAQATMARMARRLGRLRPSRIGFLPVRSALRKQIAAEAGWAAREVLRRGRSAPTGPEERLSPPPPRSPSLIAEQHEAAGRVHEAFLRALRLLPARERRIIIRVDIRGERIRDAAREEGISPSWASELLHAGRVRLLARLDSLMKKSLGKGLGPHPLVKEIVRWLPPLRIRVRGPNKRPSRTRLYVKGPERPREDRKSRPRGPAPEAPLRRHDHALEDDSHAPDTEGGGSGG